MQQRDNQTKLDIGFACKILGNVAPKVGHQSAGDWKNIRGERMKVVISESLFAVNAIPTAQRHP
jgi:hypothetical protein